MRAGLQSLASPDLPLQSWGFRGQALWRRGVGRKDSHCEEVYSRLELLQDVCSWPSLPPRTSPSSRQPDVQVGGVPGYNVCCEGLG